MNRRLPSSQSTQPNTPRPASPSPSPSCPPRHNSDSPSPRPNTSSSSGDTIYGPIQPTWPRPRDLDIRRAPAMAVFSSPNQTEHRLPDLGFDVRWHPAANRAVFRLYAHIWLVRARRNDQDEKPPPVSSRVFIALAPEHIARLAIDSTPAETAFGENTVAFTFTLSTPPTLVIPKISTGTYTHRTRASGRDGTADVDTQARDVLLRRLAACTEVTVLAKVKRNVLPKGQIGLLCAAIAGRGLVADPGLTNFATLYWGEGGEVIDGATQVFAEEGYPAPAYGADHADAAGEIEPELPAYSGPGPGALGLSEMSPRGTKRPRLASPNIDKTSSASCAAERPGNALASLEARLLTAVKASHDALRSELLAHVEATKLEILASLTDVEHAVLDRVSTKTAEMEESILTRLGEADVSVTFDRTVGAKMTFEGLL